MDRAQLAKVVRAWLLGSVCSVVAVSATAQTAPDNTKTNTRDRAKGAVTADQQKENPTDRHLTQQIRQAIVDDHALSVYAHNVKIVTQNGHVTLKGPVRSADEKRAVEAKATKIAGAANVTSEVSIAPADTSGSVPAEPPKKAPTTSKGAKPSKS